MLPIPKFYNSADTAELTTYPFGNCDAGGYAPDSTGVEIHLWNDKDSAGSDDMTYIRLSVRDSDGNEVELWTTNRWIEVKSNGGTATVDDAMTTYKKVGKNHPLWLGDIQSGKYRTLYVRLHGPTSAVEGNIALQFIVLYNDGETEESTDIFVVDILHFQDVRAADDDYIHAAISGTGEVLEVTTAINNPDIPRNISVKTTNSDTPTGDVTIEGINSIGETDSETITISAGGTAYGGKAFATVTKITLPATVSVNDTVIVGMSDKIGINHSIINATDIFKKRVNAVDETGEISGNVDTTNNTLDCATIEDFEDITVWFIRRST
jgi:hypothetical protein